MTLITYLSRVHFADGVLEEALYSELELNNCKRPVIVFEEKNAGTEFHERLKSGFPNRTVLVEKSIEPGKQPDKTISEICNLLRAHKSDVIVAFGSAKAIELAGYACHQSRDTSDPKTATSSREFFAVPGVDGLPSFTRLPIRALVGSSLKSKRLVQPSVVICDPTLTLGASADRTASAAVNALTRCLEAFLSEAYNPPADGIALDGLSRTVKNLHAILLEDSLDKRRELMAASLNGALAQQKGGGMAQIIADALAIASGNDLDEGAVKRLLLPGVLEMEDTRISGARKNKIRTILDVPLHMSLREGIQSFLSDLPLPQTLSALGVTEGNILQAARDIAKSATVPATDQAALTLMMESIREPA